MDELKGVLGDEGFPFGGWLWRGAPAEDVLDLLDDKIDVGINVELPWWKLNTLKFCGYPLSDLFFSQGMLTEEDLAVGALLLVEGVESEVD